MLVSNSSLEAKSKKVLRCCSPCLVLLNILPFLHSTLLNPLLRGREQVCRGNLDWEAPSSNTSHNCVHFPACWAENRNEDKPPKNPCSGEMHWSVFLFVLKQGQFLAGLETLAVCLSESLDGNCQLFKMCHHKFRSSGWQLSALAAPGFLPLSWSTAEPLRQLWPPFCLQS